LLNNRYRLLAALAAGGMATVYKGQDTLLNRLVAIKMLRDRHASDPQFVQRFREEAQAAANLNHPNIVTLFDVGRDVINGQERHYIVMELVEGQDLKQNMRQRAMNGDALSVDEAVNIGRQVCEGVAYAHRRGLVHCDLKPQNVLLMPEGRVKVTDFGIARAYTAALNTGERSEVVWGTPQYYAPEQAAGSTTTPASDVYSIGVMLYEMLAGRLPFESKDAQQLAQLHMTAQPQPLHTLNPNVTLQLESIVNRAMAKDPAQRYPTADQFARALVAYAQQGDEQTMMNMPPVRPPAPSPRKDDTAPTLVTGPTAPAPRATSPQPQPKAQSKPASSQPNVPPAQPKRSVITDSYPTGTLTQSRDSGPDIGIWLLGALALLCVLGLVPLYVLVYQAYSAPPSQSPDAPSLILPGATVMAPATTPTSTQQMQVPQVVGLSFNDAARDLVALGLNINQVEERPGGAYTQTVVLEQRTPAGSMVAPGSVVDVVVSQISEIVLRDVPNGLLGRVYDNSVSQTLTAIGWAVVVTPALDFSPAGTILNVEPPEGSPVAVSETVTLTVSSGGLIPLNVQMPPVTLESVTLNRDTFLPGQTAQFAVRWRANGAVGRDYNVGWFLFPQGSGTPAAQGEDREPRNNGAPAPTSTWNAGTVVDDVYSIQVPVNAPPGAYTLQLVMYSGSDRLQVTDAGNTTAPANLIVLHTIQVQ
jgi:serine/threonine-protein kinase